MSELNAPWLDGLDGTTTWNTKPQVKQNAPISSLTYDNNVSINKRTRKLQRSLSGNSMGSIRKGRSPLAALDANDTNTINRKQEEVDGDSILCGTIQQRCKSASPMKKQATLEWQRRLLGGKVAYGDQTDLFGPSGLENIFAGGSSNPASAEKPRRNRFGWPNKSDAPMPSSPPPWPSKLPVKAQNKEVNQSVIEEKSIQEELGQSAVEDKSTHASVVSDPFDLSVTDEADQRENEAGDGVVNKTSYGVTELEQEDFSPVFVSKHATVSGKVEYAAVDSKDIDILKHTSDRDDVNLDSSTRRQHPNAESSALLPEAIQEPSMYTDGPSIHSNMPQNDLSLPDNLPTGTPDAIGSFVQIQRGGYSDVGSFKNRLLSYNVTGMSEVASDVPPPAPTPPQQARQPTAVRDRQQLQVKSSPLKLFSNHDTFTSNRLLRRMSQIEPDVPRPEILKDAAEDIADQHTANDKVDQANLDDDVEVVSGILDSSPRSDVQAPGSKLPTAFRKEVHAQEDMPTSAVDDDFIIAEDEVPSKHGTINNKRSRNMPKARSEHKRPPASPLKECVPKRRRTLHASDMRRRTASSSTLPRHLIHEKLGSDNDVEQNEHQQSVNAQPLTSVLKDATDHFLAQEDRNAVEEVLEQVEQSLSDIDPATMRQRTEAVVSEVANYTIKTNQAAPLQIDGERKRSVTTQDFFREAECVMEYIRARAAKKTGLLASVEETEVQEKGVNDTLDVPKGTTRSNDHMRISREPSWEGRPRSRWREPAQSQMDIHRVTSQLRKWQEPDQHEDPDVFLESSMNEQAEAENLSSEVIYDERAQIRITKPSSEYQRDQKDQDSRPNSQRSAASANSASRRSDNVGTLAPAAVAHLIGEEVGGMTFDREKGIWVRNRSPDHKTDSNGFLDVHASHVTSEDDPFREISDLAVDEGLERRRISSPARLPATKPLGEIDSASTSAAKRPQTSYADTTSSKSSAPSRTVLISHAPTATLTQPTSFGSQQYFDQEQATDDNLIRASVASDEKIHRVIEAAELTSQTSKEFARQHALHNGTTTSAPEQNELEHLREDTVNKDDVSEIADIHSSRLRSSIRSPRQAITQQVTFGNPMVNKPELRQKSDAIREQSELSIVAPLPGDRMLSVSLSVSKPSQQLKQPLGKILDSSPFRAQSSFLLSDLPDFTVHDQDEERPSERHLAKRLNGYAVAEAGDRFAVATREVLKALTDLYSGEPYWESISTLDVRKQNLETLHGLSTFCNAVVHLDVSGNRLNHLAGAPSTTQTLIARENRLSDITSFAGLDNLQYVDLSGNQLTSFAALAGCRHLRELKADDNQIETLEEIAHLGIIKLRCRRNKLTKLSFKPGDFAHLQELDLCDGSITQIDGLEHLHDLRVLKVDRHQLQHGLHFSASTDLLVLSARDCYLTRLNLSNAPNLQYIFLDDNMLADITGLESLEHLDTLSLRRQRLAPRRTVKVLSRAFRARYVSLSGSTISKLHISTRIDVSHLDMADAGLQELPNDFYLAMSMLKTLNLQSNNIEDITPLRRMQNLETLSLSRNRIVRMRKTTAVLGSMPSLKHVDLRENPIVGSCYSSISPSTTTTSDMIPYSHDENDDEDVRLAKAENSRYTLPAADAEDDKRHVSRMDEGTQLRRRVYEMLIAQGCLNLAQLDGLKFQRALMLKRDQTWEKLLGLGVMRKVDS